MHLIQKAALLAAIALVFYFDGRYRLIPNKLITVVVGLGLVTNTIISGWTGFALATAGFFAGLIILIIPFLLGGIGAGDVKLLAAIGCLLGPGFAAAAFLYGAVFGGIWAVIVLLKKKNLLQSLQAIGYRLMLSAAGQKTAAPPLHTFASGKDWGFPFGIAIGLGAAAALVFGVPF